MEATTAGAGGWVALLRYMGVSFVLTFIAAVLSTFFLVPYEDVTVGQVARDLLKAMFHGEPGFWITYAVVAAGIVLLQAIFLLPVFRPPAVAKQPRSLLKSVAMASGAAALLCTCLAFASLELFSKVEAIEHFETHRLQPVITVPIVVFLPSWVLWGRFLWRRSRRHDPAAIDRLMSPLLGSTAIGLGLLFPIDLYVRSRKQCFCATTSAWSLAVALASLLWLLGPFVFLLATRRQRQALRRNLCLHCGYTRSRIPGSPNLRCQECGNAWSRRKEQLLERK